MMSHGYGFSKAAAVGLFTPLVLAFLWGCGEKIITPPPVPASVTPAPGSNNQTAVVGNPVATPPSVKVTSQDGTGLADISVTFVVTAGNGSVTGSPARTNASGIATVGSWTLGDMGTNTLAASVAGVTGKAIFTATAMPGPTASLNITAGDGQSAAGGDAVATPPAVTVLDEFNNPVPGVAMTFTPSGDGQVTGSPATSDASGVATVGSWILTTAPGANTLVAGTGGLTVTFNATAVTGNVPPTATISAPADGTSFAAGAAVTFTGSGSDPEDGVLTGGSLVWTSSVDGQIGTGTSVTTSALSVGTHTITLTAADSQQLSGTASITITITAVNQPPPATISAPADGASFAAGAAVTFTGSGSDPEDGALTGASLVWTSSRDGQIGTGTSVTTSALSVGTHTIILTATDSQQLLGTASITITITAVNQPPTATISAPADGASFAAGAAVTFTGSGSDPEDGALTGGSLVWTSSVDGQIGTGTSVTTSALSVGTHTITLTARDSQQLSGTASITITMTSGFSPLSGKIVFSRHVGDDGLWHPIWALLAMASDGSGLTLIGPELSTAVSFLPSGSPDGQSVAYRYGNVPLPYPYPNVVVTFAKVVRADGTAYDLWPTPDYLAMPSFSPDGRRIAARGTRSAIEDEVVVLDSDGANLRVLFTCFFGSCFDLRLSPQAWWPGETHIAVSYKRLFRAEVYLISVADGSSTLKVTGGSSGGVWDPSVSVDGWIAATSDVTGNKDIWVVSPTGTATNLTQSSFDDFDPVWSGDGTRLAFVSTRDGNAEIYVINKDGSGLTRLTNNSVTDRDPHWVPSGPTTVRVPLPGGPYQLGTRKEP